MISARLSLLVAIERRINNATRKKELKTLVQNLMKAIMLENLNHEAFERY